LPDPIRTSAASAMIDPEAVSDLRHLRTVATEAQA
jgi:hypothetical protein